MSSSAAAGPFKFGERGPSLDVAELRANGVRMGQEELRALFFRGGNSRSAAASCAECLAAESSLSARRRDRRAADYEALFPFRSANLFARRAAPVARAPETPTAAVPDLIVGPAVAAPEAVTAVAQPISGSEAVAPLAVAAPIPAPEPTSFALLGGGLVGAWLLRRRDRFARR